MQPLAPRQPRCGAMRPLRHRRPQRLPPGHRKAVPPLWRGLTGVPQQSPNPNPRQWQSQRRLRGAPNALPCWSRSCLMKALWGHRPNSGTRERQGDALMTTIVARPERVRTASQRYQLTAVAHYRLMLLLLLFFVAHVMVGKRYLWLFVLVTLVEPPQVERARKTGRNAQSCALCAV